MAALELALFPEPDQEFVLFWDAGEDVYPEFCSFCMNRPVVEYSDYTRNVTCPIENDLSLKARWQIVPF